MHHTARLYLKGSAEIEDVVQEAASQAFHHLDRLRDADHLLPWLRSIVRNRCLSHLRSRRSYLSYEEETREGETHIQVDESYWGGQPVPAPDQDLIDQEEARWVQVAVGQLSEKNRSVTSLHYFEGKSYEEIAAVLDVSLSAIEGRLYRARKQLKEVMINMAKADIDQVGSARSDCRSDSRPAGRYRPDKTPTRRHQLGGQSLARPSPQCSGADHNQIAHRPRKPRHLGPSGCLPLRG